MAGTPISGNIPIRQSIVSNGIPAEFTKQTVSQNQRIVSKGDVNKVLLRSQVLKEHMDDGNTILDTVDSSTIIGQIFKVSKANINGIALKLASGNVEVFDDFNDYADDTALQAVWVASDPANNDPEIETADPDPYEGAKYMNMSYNWESDPNPYIERTITAKDCRGGAFRFAIYPRITWGEGRFNFFVGDGTNYKRLDVVTTAVDEWQQVTIQVDAMVEDDADNPVDDENITKVGFMVDNWSSASENEWAGIDYIEFISGGGSLDLKLWDMGASIPVAGVTAIDDGTQYTTLGDPDLMTPASEITIPLVGAGGTRRYQIDDLVAGIGGSGALTPGNYYLITLNHVDTDVVVYGSDGSSDLYTDGFGFTAPDEATAITAIGANQDCMFHIYTADETYVVDCKAIFKASTGATAVNGINSFYEILIMRADGTVESMVTSKIQAGVMSASTWLRPLHIEEGGKIEMRFSDDYTDDVYKAYLIAEYAYQP